MSDRLEGLEGPNTHHSTMQDFRTLKAWQQSHTLAIDLLRFSTRWMPADLAGAVRQAALLMPSTLARGCAGTPASLIAAVRMTRLHLEDIDAYLLIARDLNELAASDYAALDIRIARLRYQLDALARTAQRHPEALVLN